MSYNNNEIYDESKLLSLATCLHGAYSYTVDNHPSSPSSTIPIDEENVLGQLSRVQHTTPPY